MPRPSIRILGLLVAGPTTIAAAQGPTETKMEQVGPGVYAIIHERATEEWPQGNSLVVIGDDGVLVVDAAYYPSAARADIESIRRLTNKPVRYLVNTHWHYDHINGNHQYLEAFPGIQIVAHRSTKRLMDENAPSFPAGRIGPESDPVKRLAGYKERLAKGVNADGAPLSAEDRVRLARNIEQREREQREMRDVAYAGPTLGIDRELEVYLGGREVRILHGDRGNTPGDVVVYLPADRILASGDLVVAPIPYAYNSYPSEWIRTMHWLDGLGAATIVPGHGPVFHDPSYLRSVLELLEQVTARVASGARDGKTADEIRTGLDLTEWRARFAGTDPFLTAVFNSSIVKALVDRAFAEARGGA